MEQYHAWYEYTQDNGKKGKTVISISASSYDKAKDLALKIAILDGTLGFIRINFIK